MLLRFALRYVDVIINREYIILCIALKIVAQPQNDSCCSDLDYHVVGLKNARIVINQQRGVFVSVLIFLSNLASSAGKCRQT